MKEERGFRSETSWQVHVEEWSSMGQAGDRVVARYADSRLLKGYAPDFKPSRSQFRLVPAAPEGAEPREVRLRDLKALFFVRDFAGDPRYSERKHFAETDLPVGRRVEVTFQDGEILVGSCATAYVAERAGFFLAPADPRSNNQRVFAVSAAIRSLRYL